MAGPLKVKTTGILVLPRTVVFHVSCLSSSSVAHWHDLNSVLFLSSPCFEMHHELRGGTLGITVQSSCLADSGIT